METRLHSWLFPVSYHHSSSSVLIPSVHAPTLSLSILSAGSCMKLSTSQGCQTEGKVSPLPRSKNPLVCLNREREGERQTEMWWQLMKCIKGSVPHIFPTQSWHIGSLGLKIGQRTFLRLILTVVWYNVEQFQNIIFWYYSLWAPSCLKAVLQQFSTNLK